MLNSYFQELQQNPNNDVSDICPKQQTKFRKTKRQSSFTFNLCRACVGYSGVAITISPVAVLNLTDLCVLFGIRWPDNIIGTKIHGNRQDKS